MGSSPAYDHEYPPSDWTVDGIATALKTTAESYPIPRYEDEESWAALRSDPALQPLVESILDRASRARGEPIPTLRASMYLDFARTGNRTRYQNAADTRLRRLSLFALAECLERDGTYLDEVLDYAWATCEQATWILPAHLIGNERQDSDGLPGVVDDEDRYPPLRAAGIAELLSVLDYVLGDQLPAALGERIRDEIDRRVLVPTEARDDFWWLTPPTNNWNAVCNSGAAIAAMHVLDDADRIARLLVKTTRSLGHYLAEFDTEGCTPEGVGYWSYGFGNYVKLAAHLEERTDGAYSLFSPPIVDKIAEFPLKVTMSPGRFVPFSDGEEDCPVFPYTACCLGAQLDKEGVGAFGRQHAPDPEARFHGRNAYYFGEILRDLAWSQWVPEDWGVPTPPKRQVFEGVDWWISRENPTDSDALVVAAKGGHNGESHNHNDCGSFVVHVGRESLLTDLGRPVYDRDYFGEDRYSAYLTPRSLGHSVPYINGCEQVASDALEDRDATAEMLSVETGDTDAVAFDIAGCYPADAGLESLQRRIALARETGTVTVTDDVEFTDGPGSVESVLVSYDPIAVRNGALTVTGENGRLEVTTPADASVSVEHLEDAVDVSWRPGEEYWDVWRARIEPPSAESVSIELGIEPVERM